MAANPADFIRREASSDVRLDHHPNWTVAFLRCEPNPYEESYEWQLDADQLDALAAGALEIARRLRVGQKAAS